MGTLGRPMAVARPHGPWVWFCAAAAIGLTAGLEPQCGADLRAAEAAASGAERGDDMPNEALGTAAAQTAPAGAGSPAAEPAELAEPVEPVEPVEGARSTPEPDEAGAAGQDEDGLDQQIARLIEQLGDPDYFVRERAQAALAEVGFDAFDALMAATSHPDLEVAARARYLLRLLSTQWAGADDPPEVQRLLADYQSQSNQEKQRRIRLLGELPEAKGLDALVRVVRRERSEVLSKWAAVEWMRHLPDGPGRAAEVARMKQGLRRSRRTAALWLMARAKVLENVQTGLPNWSQLVAAEQQRLARSPDQTSPEIVAALLRLEIEWAKQAGLTAQAMEAMRRLVELDSGDPEVLAELLDWMIGQEAWEAIEQLAAKSKAGFESDPLLLYMLAEAQLAQGRREEAEQTAQRAAGLNPSAPFPSPEGLVDRLSIALRLRQRGLFRWAEREYRAVVAVPAANRQITYMAWLSLAEMLHELAKDEQAAEAVRSALTLQGQHGDAELAGRDAKELRSRMHYFLACHYASDGDQARQLEELDKAIAIDPPDLDALIARYRLLEATPADRGRVLQLIQASAKELEGFIIDDPENPTWYNQYAWLVGNTEGDLDKALRYSQKSIELRPDAGGYYDTLAHVHFARGEYEKAVQVQEKAVKLEPHSPILRRKLEGFRAALEKQRTEGGTGGTQAAPGQSGSHAPDQPGPKLPESVLEGPTSPAAPGG